jgi:Rrf2 family protein
MVISARIHYACLAMLELALRNDDDAPVAIREIAERHQIPGPFLVQILRTLRAHGWVKSVRGSQGGYRLSVHPSRLTLLDIADAIGCQETQTRASAITPMDEILQANWEEASQVSRRVLSKQRLSDIVQRCRNGDAEMFYI